MIAVGTDEITVYAAPAGTDSHGWQQPPDGEPIWSGRGSLQLVAGPSDPFAAGGGGAGPFAPAQWGTGTLYLPPEVGYVTDGMVAVVRGRPYVLSGAFLNVDQTGPADLTCWVATATEARTLELDVEEEGV